MFLSELYGYGNYHIEIYLLFSSVLLLLVLLSDEYELSAAVTYDDGVFMLSELSDDMGADIEAAAARMNAADNNFEGFIYKKLLFGLFRFPMYI